MEKLVSSWCNTTKSVPESYVLPPEKRPGKLAIAPPCQTIPVIDLQRLSSDRSELVHQLIKASQEYGCFQLTKHGISEELMENVLRVGKEFFELPMEQKASLYSEDPNQICRLKTSNNYAQEKVHFWRDSLSHPCHPLEDFIQYWPTNPPHYREVFGRYAIEVRKLSLQLLDIICEGLGLIMGYFEGGLSQVHLMNINYYPPCPDPTLVLGTPQHIDPRLITLLNQGDVPGLQVLKDDQWFLVDPLPNAFVVIINHTLQVISNGKLKSVNHRVVTNRSVARITIGSFISPSNDSFIEPAKSLVNEYESPPVYKSFIYKDFSRNYKADVLEEKDTLQRYMIQS